MSKSGSLAENAGFASLLAQDSSLQTKTPAELAQDALRSKRQTKPRKSNACTQPSDVHSDSEGASDDSDDEDNLAAYERR